MWRNDSGVGGHSLQKCLANPVFAMVVNYLGRVHLVVHKSPTIFIYICPLNTTSINDIIGDQFQS